MGSGVGGSECSRNFRLDSLYFSSSGFLLIPLETIHAAFPCTGLPTQTTSRSTPRHT